MKCINCGKDILIRVATKINCKDCKVLTNMTSVITVQCDFCKHIFQSSVQSNSMMNIQNDDQ